MRAGNDTKLDGNRGHMTAMVAGTRLSPRRQESSVSCHRGAPLVEEAWRGVGGVGGVA